MAGTPSGPSLAQFLRNRSQEDQLPKSSTARPTVPPPLPPSQPNTQGIAAQSLLRQASQDDVRSRWPPKPATSAPPLPDRPESRPKLSSSLTCLEGSLLGNASHDQASVLKQNSQYGGPLLVSQKSAASPPPVPDRPEFRSKLPSPTKNTLSSLLGKAPHDQTSVLGQDSNGHGHQSLYPKLAADVPPVPDRPESRPKLPSRTISQSSLLAKARQDQASITNQDIQHDDRLPTSPKPAASTPPVPDRPKMPLPTKCSVESPHPNPESQNVARLVMLKSSAASCPPESPDAPVAESGREPTTAGKAESQTNLDPDYDWIYPVAAPADSARPQPSQQTSPPRESQQSARREPLEVKRISELADGGRMPEERPGLLGFEPPKAGAERDTAKTPQKSGLIRQLKLLLENAQAKKGDSCDVAASPSKPQSSPYENMHREPSAEYDEVYDEIPAQEDLKRAVDLQTPTPEPPAPRVPPPMRFPGAQNPMMPEGKPPSYEETASGPSCTVHKGEVLAFYCSDCRTALCPACWTGGHPDHAVGVLNDHLKKKIEAEEEQTYYNPSYAQRTISDSADQLELIRDQQLEFKAKRADLEKAVCIRHAKLEEVVKFMRNEALKSLDAVCGEFEGALEKLLQQQEAIMQNLLENQAERTPLKKAPPVTSAAGNDVTSASPRPAVLRLEDVTRFHPVISLHAHDDAMVTSLGRFACTVTTMETSIARAHVTAKLNFRCGVPDESGIRVFSLCHIDDSPAPSVLVSYERRKGHVAGVPAEKYTEMGKCLGPEAFKGKVTFRRFAPGRYLCAQSTDAAQQTFAKSTLTSDPEGLYRLENDGKGKARVIRVRGTFKAEAVKIDTQKVCSFKVGPHRSFDVSEDGEMFVIVEVPRSAPAQRQVRLYLLSRPECACTYNPPAPVRSTFQPSDVCFYRMGGHMVLLVADEGNNAIHVVRAHPQDGMAFLRYLIAPRGSFVVRPTALNLDGQGHLWVASEEGMILSMGQRL